MICVCGYVWVCVDMRVRLCACVCVCAGVRILHTHPTKTVLYPVKPLLVSHDFKAKASLPLIWSTSVISYDSARIS